MHHAKKVLNRACKRSRAGRTAGGVARPLRYMSTIGLSSLHFYLSDRVHSPPEYKAAYVEKLMYHPFSMQAASHRRLYAPLTPGLRRYYRQLCWGWPNRLPWLSRVGAYDLWRWVLGGTSRRYKTFEPIMTGSAEDIDMRKKNKHGPPSPHPPPSPPPPLSPPSWLSMAAAQPLYPDSSA